MKRSRRLNCIWLMGLLLLLACARPAATVEAAPSPTAEPATAAPVTATPLPVDDLDSMEYGEIL